MNEHSCIRCHHPLTLEAGHLTYCSACGAAQIFLSEELSAQLAEGARAYGERTAAAPAAEAGAIETDTRGRRRRRLHAPRVRGGGNADQPWTLAVPYALLAGAVTLGLGVLSLLLPPFSILMLLWVVGAPVLTVGYFNARFTPEGARGAGFAARLGLLTGLIVAFCTAIVFTLSLLLTRYAFHDADLLDTQFASMFDQQRAAVLARVGSSAQPTLDLFLVPEYRVGILLFVLATSAVAYVLLSTFAGGVAGLVLRKRRSP